VETTRATGNTDTILTVLSSRFCRQGQSTGLGREGPAKEHSARKRRKVMVRRIKGRPTTQVEVGMLGEEDAVAL
jgi:hypothetical protein